MSEGVRDAQRQRRRSEAGWVSYLLTALTKNVVTAGQLLGETSATVEDQAKEGERKLKALKRKMAKAQKKG